MPNYPPIGLSVNVTDANGVVTRWGSEDAYPENIPRGITFGTQRMQGFGVGSCALRRRIDRDWVDVHLLDDISFVGAGGEIAYEGRIGAMPRSFDTDHTITLQLAGHMSLANDRTFTEIYVDRDLGAWGEPSRSRKATMLAANFATFPITVGVDPTDGLPALITDIRDSWVSPYTPVAENLYDAGPNNLIGSIYVDVVNTAFGASWSSAISTMSDDKATAAVSSGNLCSAASATTRLTPTVGYRYARYQHTFTTTPAGAQGARYSSMLRNVAVYGNHGLPLAGSEPQGIQGSEIIKDIARRFCPDLNVAGVQTTGFPIPHLVFREPTRPYDAFLAVNAYNLWNLAVWEDKTLYYGPVDLTDYDWEIRTDDVGVTLDLQGDSSQDLANGIVVKFTNVETGLTDILTPDVYTDLQDTSIDNPANMHGHEMWTDYQLSVPATRAAALQIGRAALIEFNSPKAPGTITASHYVKDRAGHFQPAWKVRAGDRVAITSSTSLSDRPRLISETSYDHDSQTVTMALEGIPKRLAAVIDRITTALEAANLAA